MRFIIFLLITCHCVIARSHEYFTDSFRLIHPWSEASNAHASEAKVYCIFDDVNQTDILIDAITSIADKVEIRKTINVPSKKWEKLSSLEIPENVASNLSEDTVYLALVGLRAPLQWGRSYPMQLRFQRAGIINVMVSVGAH